MSKAVLISVSPKQCDNIASGKQTVIVNKTKPKSESPFFDTPFKVYIYCTNGYIEPDSLLFVNSGKGKVIGEFVCKSISYVESRIDSDGHRHLGNTLPLEGRICISDDELFDYLYRGENKSNYGWAWYISNLVIYDKPKELSEFALGCSGCRNKDTYHCTSHCEGEREMKRPPQSWCYVEELT